jgi:hypothetical protein
MNPFFRIELLAAKQGDALWLEYGNSSRIRRILIDAGPIDAFPQVEKKLRTLPDGDKRVELAVITHVDTDHIEGMIRLFAEKRQNWLIAPQDIWFNGYRHMTEATILGGREGDFLSALLHQRSFDNWNKAFDKNAVRVEAKKPLPKIQLEEGMTLTLLSPDAGKLKQMADKWEKDVNTHGFLPGDLETAWKQLLNYTKLHPNDGILGGPGEIDQNVLKDLKTDQSAANGSCIAFLAEFAGKSCLFLGDAHAGVITKSLKKLLAECGQVRLKVDAVKVSHHGSRNNISKALLDCLDARHFLISINGKYHHPNPSAIKAIIQGSLQDPVLWFNYRSPQTAVWERSPESDLRPYITRYPDQDKEGIMLDLFSE